MIVFIMHFGVLILYLITYLFLSFLSVCFVFRSLTLLSNYEIHDYKSCVFISVYCTVPIKVYEMGVQ